MMGVWERTVVIVSKDDNLTKSHVRYLETRSSRWRRTRAAQT